MSTKRCGVLGFLLSAACVLAACGSRGAPGAPARSPAAEPSAPAGTDYVHEPAGARGAAPKSERAPAAQSAPAAAGPPPLSVEPPGAAGDRARSERATIQLSQAKRDLEVATSQRDCAYACRALESMERAALQICENARSPDDQRACRQSEEQVAEARDRVRAACGECPSRR